nr:FAD-dependent oxidoreductase [Puia sp.]
AIPESAAVNFLPALPEKVNAAKQIGFGSVIKLLTQWKQPFWKEKTTDLQFIFSGEPIPTWWTQHPMESNLLTGWLGGPAAEKLSILSDQELLDIGMDCLSRIFQMRRAELDELLIDAICCNWKRDIFSAGAYSFTLSGFQDARRRWQEPIEDTLYFAGEACYSGPHIGTVEAAIVSGIDAAKTLLKQSGSHK